jgi:hypothetical protein
LIIDFPAKVRGADQRTDVSGGACTHALAGKLC